MVLSLSPNHHQPHPPSPNESRRNSYEPSSASSSSSNWQIPTQYIGHLETREIIRQSAIHEIITGEADYLDDLKTYQNIFVEPLQDQLSPAIFQHIERERFLDQVVSSLEQIRQHKHVSNIPRFNARKKDFRHFYSRATFRLARYVLLFTRLLEATPETHADREPLRLALELVRRQCSECNSAIESQQDAVRLVKLNSMIAPKSDIPLLHLHSSHRKIYSSGQMLRKKDGGSGLGEWSEVFVVLFDHYFVMLKEKKEDGHPRPRYHIVEQPIRTEFLKISGLTQPPEKRSRRLKTITDGLRGHGANPNNNQIPPLKGQSSPARRSKSEPIQRHSYTPANEHSNDPESSASLQQSRSLYPMTLQPFGDSPRIITLYVESESARQHWRECFETAINNRVQSIKTSHVFELWPMALETFSIPSSSSSSSSLVNLPSLAELKVLYEDQIPKELLPNTVHHGAPTCSTPFIAPDGRPLTAIGCKEGLWIGKRDNSNCVPSKRRILYCTRGQVLLAYPVEILVHSPGVKSSRPPAMRSITTNSNSTHLPKPSRPAVPYHQQQPHQQILSRATSASSQQSARSRQSCIGNEVEFPAVMGRTSLLLSLGMFEFERKQATEAEAALSSSGCDETSVSSASFPKASRLGMDSCESSVPSSPDSSHKRFWEFRPATNSTGRHRRMTSESCTDAYRMVPSLAITTNNRAGVPLENNVDQDKRRGLVRLSGLSDKVRFFKVGTLENRLVLIYAEKGKGSQTAFKVVEPISGSNEKLGYASTLFKENKEITVPYEAHAVQCHETQNKLLVFHGNRCEVLNLDDLTSETIPQLEADRDDPACNILMQRMEEAKLLNILTITSKEYLFCYDKFAYFASSSGNVIRKKFDKMIEWDGRPSVVNRLKDYVIGYSENLIEVWDLRSSTRVQIMHGKDIRCIYNGEGGQLRRAANSATSFAESLLQQKSVKPDYVARFSSCELIREDSSRIPPIDDDLDNRPLSSSDKIPSSSDFLQNHFDAFHVSIKDSGNVYRVFEMGRVSN
ncbi:hypothetical protein H4Q26_007704 [Puccinia striiformis f. sp. tritici PST-130]|nr:hypothetical protein H4Q26_007704 [Puccinia striiformis f. sp. tritici PST-130]